MKEDDSDKNRLEELEDSSQRHSSVVVMLTMMKSRLKEGKC